MIICEAALAKHGEMNTRVLAAHIFAANGLGTGDGVLMKSIAEWPIHALRVSAWRRRL